MKGVYCYMPNHPIPPKDSSPIIAQLPLYPEALEVTDVHLSETTPKNGRLRFAALIITVIGITAAAVAWAAHEHDYIKEWTAERDYATKKEVVDIVEKHYVSAEDFVEVKVEQKHIKEKVDKIDYKVDEMHKLLIRGERPRRHDRTHERRDE